MTVHIYTDFCSSMASHKVSHNAILVLHLCVQEATMCWVLAFRERVRLDDILPSWLLILHKFSTWLAQFTTRVSAMLAIGCS